MRGHVVAKHGDNDGMIGIAGRWGAYRTVFGYLDYYKVINNNLLRPERKTLNVN